MRQKRRQRKHKIARRTAFRLRMKAAAAVAAAGAHVSNSTIGEFPTLNGTRNNNNSGTCTKNVRKPKRRLRQGSTMVSSVQKSPDSRSKRQRRKVVNTSRATKVKSTKDNSDVTTTAVQKEESKCLILKLLGDKAKENELLTDYEADANLLQDLDLVVLAAPPEDYKRYTQLLRREYQHMNDETFKTMRLKVLQTLLTIPNIFSTPEFQSQYELAARTNIKEEISTLKA